MPTQSEKLLTLVRGLPGSGRTTLARSVAGEKGRLLAPEEDLFPGFSPINPAAMAEADSESLVHMIRLMGQQTPHIVLERVFGRLWTMRPFVEVAQREQYRVAFCEPQTDWAHDPRRCHARSKKPVTFDELHQVNRTWESDPSVESVLASRTPGERLLEAKTILAQRQAMAAEQRTSDPAFSQLEGKLTTDFQPELRHLQFLGYFDPRFSRRVGLEFSQILASKSVALNLEDEVVQDSPAAQTASLAHRVSVPPALGVSRGGLDISN